MFYYITGFSISIYYSLLKNNIIRLNIKYFPYFTYFNYIEGTSPGWGNEIKDRTGLSLRYYIDSEGNVIEPANDSKGINLSNST